MHRNPYSHVLLVDMVYGFLTIRLPIDDLGIDRLTELPPKALQAQLKNGP